MVSVPKEIMSGFVVLLPMRDVPVGQMEFYKKWLRYYYDFSQKYLHEQDNAVKVRLFLEKLKSKGQTVAQCQQAAHAVALYFEIMSRNTPGSPVTATRNHAESTAPSISPNLPELQVNGQRFTGPGNGIRPAQYNVAAYQEKSDSPEWDEVMEKLAAEIKVRHYSRKTLQTYAKWSRSFQRFLKSKPPSELTTEDVKDYLTFLAVKCHVAASIQNQAFNSLVTAD